MARHVPPSPELIAYLGTLGLPPPVPVPGRASAPQQLQLQPRVPATNVSPSTPLGLVGLLLAFLFAAVGVAAWSLQAKNAMSTGGSPSRTTGTPSPSPPACTPH